MASSSSQSCNYAVFLSFRGEDTRKTFVDHLYSALVDRLISTYKDDETLPRGESIRPALLEAIEGSRIAVIIFSKNYADSSWCLDELAYIMECKNKRGLTVMPVFYDVAPSEIRKQEGEFGFGFAKQETRNSNKVESWRKALVDASEISGWEPKNIANGSIGVFKSIQSTSMASSSQSCNYAVFLSFRGEDTCKTFVDHLYPALVDRLIPTYKDDETLPRGESIRLALLEAIEGSRIAVIIFSKNYADSSWCLDELAYIMECKNKRGLTVMPVFYDVTPSEIRKQEGEFGIGFAKQKARNSNKVESWRKALVDASEISGWEPKNIAKRVPY